MNRKELKKIKLVLSKIRRLFLDWGIKTSDWMLALHYAEILCGYKIKKSLRSGHLNILVKASTLPWKVKDELLRIETVIPTKGKHYKQYQKFQKRFSFDFDLMPYSDKNFKLLVDEYSLEYKLGIGSGGSKILLLNVLGSLMIIDEYLGKYYKEIGEKAERIFIHLKEIKYTANKLKDYSVLGSSKNILEKYSSLINKKTKTTFSLVDKKEVKGIVVFKSKKPVIGEVLIKNNLKVPCFKTGCETEERILVCRRLTQSMVPLALRSLAIITDDGGILSHAAIVSRELGIPCIIGTKIATQVLKDWDLVEVDANKGVVRILKNRIKI